MADITMCRNYRCLRRHTCYRYTAIFEPLWQAYGEFKGPKCTHYCPNLGYLSGRSIETIDEWNIKVEHLSRERRLDNDAC